MKTLRLDDNQATALRSALDSYLDGYGMPDQDEDEPAIISIMEMLDEAGA
jgi:hypothetical protein